MRQYVLFFGASTLALTAACASAPEPKPPAKVSPTATATTTTTATTAATTTAPTTMTNPLLEKWTGPFGGVPPFAKVKVDLFKPAILAGMDEQRREVDAIAKNTAPPTFENTIAAMEDMGRGFDRVMTLYHIWSSTMADADFQTIEREMAPKLAAFEDEITQNEALFKRIEAVYNSPEKAKLTPEQQRLTWRHYTSFVRSGAKLDATAKKRVAEINQRLATLFTSFSQNVLADEENYQIVIEKEADLEGLPDSLRSAAAAAAKAKGMEGRWVITNTRSSVEPFLTYSARDDLREKVWKNFVSRGDNNDTHDTKKLISEILKLRAERAKLLGYETHAHWRLENSMAKTPERAMALMEEVWPAAVARVKEEVADMQAIAKKGGLKRKFEPWDYRFYAEKVRKAKYDLDENEVKPYLQLEKLREGMFWVAEQLFGFTFTPITNVEVYHPDVRVWEVKNKATGKHVGLWYFDPYARKGKMSGAWMHAYRNQGRFKGDVTRIVTNNSNVRKG